MSAEYICVLGVLFVEGRWTVQARRNVFVTKYYCITLVNLRNEPQGLGCVRSQTQLCHRGVI